MNVTAIINAVTIGLNVLDLAVKVGTDIATISGLISKIKGWLDGTSTPTEADTAELQATQQKYLDMLNDTSGDDPPEV